MDKFLPVNEILSALNRRKLVFGLVAFFGTFAAFFYAINLPRLYETSAVIQIKSPTVSAAMSSSQNATRAMQQLQRTEQQLMARDNLLAMIDRFQLFHDHPEMSGNDKVFELRQATMIEQVINPTMQWRADVSPTALTITVRLGNPEMVAKVANEFVVSVLNHNRTRREERVRDTLQFFKSEENRVGSEISTLDAEIANFRRQNADAMPEALEGKRRQLSSLQDADLALEQQLIELTRSPAENRRASVAKKILLLEEQRAAISERRFEIEAALTAAPEIEKTFNSLTRKLRLLEEQFTIITRHRAEAEMGQMLEDSRQSENYEVLELAHVPESPIAPSRKKVFLAGVSASLALGIALVYLLETLNPVIRSAAQMERQLNIRPVVSIPNIETRNDLTRRWVAKTAMVILVLVGLPITLMVVDAYVFPLSALVEGSWLTKLASK